MLIENIRDEAIDGWRQLSADIRFESDGGCKEKFWVRRSGPDVPFQRPGDILLVSFSLPAMARGERLSISVPVSADLAEAELGKATRLLRSWYPRLSDPQLECDYTDPESADAAATAALFSGGVDSWFTLIRKQQEIDALVHFQGYEIDFSQTAAWNSAHQLVGSVAQSFDKKVITLATNLQQIVGTHIEERPEQPWPHFRVKVFQGHGGIARALALRGLINRIIVPSSYSRDAVQCGSHQDIEEGLSTQGFNVVLDGIDSSRLEKIDFLLAEYPDFVTDLRICVSENPPVSRPLNCGDCAKCIRGALELRVCGATDYDRIFAQPVDIRQARLKRLFTDTISWPQIVDRAKLIGDKEVRDAALMLMGKARLKRRLVRIPNTFRRLGKKLAN